MSMVRVDVVKYAEDSDVVDTIETPNGISFVFGEYEVAFGDSVKSSDSVVVDKFVRWTSDVKVEEERDCVKMSGSGVSG